MIRKACIMKVFPNCHEEYRKRHEGIWPEMVNMLTEYGAHNYSIHLDPTTNSLFAYLEIEEEGKWSKSAETQICKKWWAYMKDVMETNPDNSPVVVNLQEVFYQA
ncbi:L-rhamnose mutarotase [Pelosinus sp. IPA-1]|uniref:L-rhamnose mutarotase n=1 Tax=Pelosinus sp. IPA-1 TaxID=3029569 RepID=UPI0024361EE2|nr:L-rhamnose mutarotase [Pelosinus sp. IPA-1]GMA97402.1 L-rhamnose mutarotase [Pelosinus sp. IPA-1]